MAGRITETLMPGVESLADAAGYVAWRGGTAGVSVVFAGIGPAASGEEVLARITGEQRPVAWARQVHSARVLAARAGDCGEGDALLAHEPGLALAIVTADCVPVLIAGPRRLAAAHAGWRGIAAGVVAAAVDALGDAAAESTAWIGPAIGPCCYETAADVAGLVAAASHPEIVSAGAAGRPHLDLPAAVRHQLEAAGLRDIRHLACCTRCHPAHLHSFRREGKGAGRNHAFIWRH
jgi:polyphenol oxidase